MKQATAYIEPKINTEILNKNIKIKNTNNQIITISGKNKNIKKIYFFIKNEKNKNKIIIINFDFFDESFKKILKNKKENNKNNKIKIEKNIDYINGINLIYNKNKKIKIKEFKKEIYKIKKQYDYVIINISNESFLEYNKKIMEISDINYFIIKNEINNIKLSKKILKIYDENWKIKKEKIKIIFFEDERNKNKIFFILIKLIFYKFKFIKN